MRRITVLTLIFVSLLSGITSIPSLTEVPISPVLVGSDAWSQNMALPPSNSCCVSPPESSPPSVAYVTNVSSLAYWQRNFATRVNETRLLGLLTLLASFNSRHPFTNDGNASIDFVASHLTSLGISYTDDWFSIPKAIWTGAEYLYQHYWTRNLYITPWKINTSNPSLIITSHLDSTRHGIFGISFTEAPGANDNAGGIASLLETLDILTKTSRTFQNWNVLFAFLGGEEGNGTHSLWGSSQLISHGMASLGIDPTSSFVLNIDEIAFLGTIWPTILTLFRYPNEDVSPLQTPVTLVSENLNIQLLDAQRPRVGTLGALQSDFGWCISEWAFHRNNIPTLTISTNQYPDPYKHTLYDRPLHCTTINLVNATKLIIGLILALTLDLPPNPPNNVDEWVPIFSQIANITITDYLNPHLSTYQALVLDPLILIDPFLVSQLSHLSVPLLILGKAGSQFLQQSIDVSCTTEGTQALRVQGLKAFHPVIQSPSLLKEDAQLFRECSLVYAISPYNDALVLVGNTTWSSLVYYPPTLLSGPILFLGLNLPETSSVEQITHHGLRWLLDTTHTGICMGIDQKNPVVGASPTLFIFVGNLANWTGYSFHPLWLKITILNLTEEYHIITNETGVAQLDLSLRTPSPHSIQAQSPFLLATLYILIPSTVCSAQLQYTPFIQQGESLSVFCYINSSLSSPTSISLSLSQDKVGNLSKTNLLLVPGENLFHLTMEILPSCSPQAYNLTLIISTPPLILLTEKVPLIVQAAFLLTFIALPDHAIQNSPFVVIVNLTNLGSHTRAFDIIANPDFSGCTQVIVQANETRTVTFFVQYISKTLVDAGIRSLSLTFLLENQQILSLETKINVNYSILNLILSSLPLLFLFVLCILGIFWLRNGKRSQHQTKSVDFSPTTIIPLGDWANQIQWDTTESEWTQQQLALNPQVMQTLSQFVQKLGLTRKKTKRYSNDMVLVAREKKGQELHIVLHGANTQRIQQLFHVLSETALNTNQKGGLSES